MAQYRMLEDHYVNNQLLAAGTTQTTQDENGAGLLPANWTPSANVEPMNASAVTQFYNQGPKPLGLVRQQFSTVFVVPPTTFWKATVSANSQTTSYSLTGLGASLAPINQ
jgi:hypothetical protein